ncbi:DUF3226 domain-containing protein [Mariniflexile aquimaris]|uniref:DUF3226 domain-containing protein n=1 Tax=Mariniflexile aquimaris TaxID=881009 RepID=A0ABW3BVH7_9FLAO
MLVIITEGKDEVFIKKYLENQGYTMGVHFATNSIGGWTKLELSKSIIEKHIDEGHTVVLVFDADTVEKKGGFIKRSEELNYILKKLNFQINFFLFPNNTNDGDFESLLESIASSDRKDIFKCFDAYEACVKSLNKPSLNFITPIRKSRIYAYMETFPEIDKLKSKELKAGSNFFDNKSYWDLNSKALEPLNNFLTQYLQ